jgi:excisionase family DNA binding protein
MADRTRVITTDVLLTCAQAATFLNLKPSTLRAWTSRRRIPFVKLANGRAVRLRQSDLQKIIKAGLRPALQPYRTPENPADAENGGGER